MKNSKVAFFYIKEKYPSSSYNQGTTFSKEMINNLPVPKMSSKDQDGLIEKVDKILDLTKSKDYLQNAGKQARIWYHFKH